MSGDMIIYYDEDADFLEINIGNYTKGYFRDISEGISERIDEKTGKITGIAIMSFKKRMKNAKNFKLPFKIDIIS